MLVSMQPENSKTETDVLGSTGAESFLPLEFNEFDGAFVANQFG